MTRADGLYREHSRLVNVMFTRPGLTKSERRRHESVKANLDAIEMSRLRPGLDRLQAMVDEQWRIAHEVRCLLRQLPEVAGNYVEPCLHREHSHCDRGVGDDCATMSSIKEEVNDDINR